MMHVKALNHNLYDISNHQSSIYHHFDNFSFDSDITFSFLTISILSAKLLFISDPRFVVEIKYKTRRRAKI